MSFYLLVVLGKLIVRRKGKLMKNRKLKRGFTLVELIVVIAIVAILAAVSVVSYIAFINQANESSDIQLVKQLNTVLIGDEALNGTRSTMNEMLGVVSENGFDVEKLSPTSKGYDIVWDQKANRFALIDESSNLKYGEDSFKNHVNYQTWKIVDTEAKLASSEYAVYLSDKFPTNVEVEVSTGFDAGNAKVS